MSPQTVSAQPSEDFPLDSLFQPCPDLATIVVELDFGPGNGAREDLDVSLRDSAGMLEKFTRREDTRFVFSVANEGTYVVEVSSPVWFPSANKRYEAIAKVKQFTQVNLPVGMSVIRFVRGRDGVVVQGLGISREMTTLGIPDVNTLTLPPLELVDPHIFQVEVFAPSEQGDVIEVRLEALCPEYAEGTTLYAPSAPISWAPFSEEGGELAARSLSVKAGRVDEQGTFRTCGLRLVVDRADKASLPTQTLLVTDAVDSGNYLMEILDQKVRANALGQWADAELGEDKRRINLSLRILRSGIWREMRDGKRTGWATDSVKRNRSAPIADVESTLRHCLKTMRRFYAQASMSLRLNGPPQVVPYPSNAIRICATQNVTAGYSVDVTLTPSRNQSTNLLPDLKFTVAVGQNDTAATVAMSIQNEITARITAFNQPGGQVQGVAHSTQSRFHGQVYPVYEIRTIEQGQTALLLVGRPQQIKNLKLQPSRTSNIHQYEPGIWTSSKLPQESAGNFLNAYEETLLASFNTPSHINVFVVSGLEGHGATYATDCLILADCITRNGYYVRTLPHEVMHALTQCGHTHETTDMMHNEMEDAVECVPEGGLDALPENGPKRIHERVRYERQAGNEGMVIGDAEEHLSLLRTRNPFLLSRW